MSRAIVVDGLSKRYRIGALQARPRSLREAIARGAAGLLRRGAASREVLWALRDVSFEVGEGEVLGVIGRNGAGKTTLLKILSRITSPTEGRATIRGRVGCLLEVGTGFHPELTGRENVYLNGAILGMRRTEIDAKFDEIVAFAEVERFIDTPVKFYSSGMAMRLAFAVAAHLDPEILLVDEVLAVGDARFQRKCLGKMQDVAGTGRTVLFVSHNLSTIRELCRTGLVVERGRIAYRGGVAEALATYAAIGREAEGEDCRATGWECVRIGDAATDGCATIRAHDAFDVHARLALARPVAGGQVYCIVTDALGQQVVHRRVDTRAFGRRGLGAGGYDVHVRFPALWLAPGAYTVHFKFLSEAPGGGTGRHHSERVLLDVVGSAEGNSRAVLAPRVRWSLRDGAEMVSVVEDE